MRRVFFIVGPTATGKSELAADIARETSAEIVSADAFQIYRGLDLLTAKPEPLTLAKAPHHLVGTVPVTEEMNAERFRCAALRAIDEINSRGKSAIVGATQHPSRHRKRRRLFGTSCAKCLMRPQPTECGSNPTSTAFRPFLNLPWSTHFWPFTDVLRRIPQCVTLEMQKLKSPPSNRHLF